MYFLHSHFRFTELSVKVKCVQMTKLHVVINLGGFLGLERAVSAEVEALQNILLSGRSHHHGLQTGIVSYHGNISVYRVSTDHVGGRSGVCCILSRRNKAHANWDIP